jgi:hypothetical protein
MGHFSFDELGSENEARHGYFTCLVDTDSADKAAYAFKDLILSLNKTEDMFSRISVVYLEDIVKITHLPKEAFVTRIQSSAGQFPKSITRSFLGAVSPEIEVHGLASDIREGESSKSTDEYKTSQPFIKF